VGNAWLRRVVWIAAMVGSVVSTALYLYLIALIFMRPQDFVR